MPATQRRMAELVVCSPMLTAAQIAATLGIQSDDPTGDCWTVRDSGDDATDIDALTRAVLARVNPAWSSLEDLAAANDLQIVMRVVAYLSPMDRIGGGISLDAEQLRRLGSIGAALDLDLYSNE